MKSAQTVVLLLLGLFVLSAAPDFIRFFRHFSDYVGFVQAIRVIQLALGLAILAGILLHFLRFRNLSSALVYIGSVLGSLGVVHHGHPLAYPVAYSFYFTHYPSTIEDVKSVVGVRVDLVMITLFILALVLSSIACRAEPSDTDTPDVSEKE
ncbi:hypothetical protein OH491_11515 [Termitidicoccus mucosus]|uniref:Uncharacterized protein n=1 Tax=Termitidicoccus mucosus TaxID=1184151 RepID=A0A178IFB4_9BACT|nr:hypothetical protein AW736_15865 [Opitutaceae bacterium TSB47]